MDSDLIELARRYAEHRGLLLGPALGEGIHGIVLRAKHHQKPAEIAIKFHTDPDPFRREVAVYEKLRWREVVDICGLNVPQFLHSDPAFRALEMTIVARPFVLDFAAAYIEDAPVFAAEVMADWESEKREQFGPQWPTVQRILSELRAMGIHQTDVSPRNIGFE